MLLRKVCRKFGKIAKKIEKKKTDYNNLTPKIIDLTERSLWKEEDHPLQTLALKLREFYEDDTIEKSELQNHLPKSYSFFDDYSPVVSTIDNFDKILIGPDHITRKRSDTYYVNEDVVLRTHTSAHQNYVLNKGEDAFCVLGDVYRKDEVDKSHYPVFHQMEALRYYDVDLLKEVMNEHFSDIKINDSEINQEKAYHYFGNDDIENVKLIQLITDDLKETHQNLVKFLMSDNDLEIRWNNDFFPFTEPSFELEIWFQDDWLEMLGSGVVHKDVMKMGGVDPSKYLGWASGIGLERWALLLYDIPDIRLFWSQDKRFIQQFKKGEVTQFKPFSKYPACFKDVAFYVDEEYEFEENDLHSLIREQGGDLIEEVKLIDVFHNQKLGKISRCFRINYRSLERTLTNEEIDEIQFKIRDDIEDNLGYELR